MRRRLALAATPVLAAALIAAGCGDDETTTTTAVAGPTGASGPAGPPLSEEDFVAQGNAICERGQADLDAEAQRVFGGNQPPSEDEEVEFVEETVIPGLQGQIDAVRALAPPEELQAGVTRALDDAQDALDRAKDDPTLLTGQTGGQDLFAEVNDELKAVGLTECA